MSRWAYVSGSYIFQSAIKGLREHRQGGQTGHHLAAHSPYLIDITNERYEAFAKNAYIFNQVYGSNIALILSGSLHHRRALYGQRRCDSDERSGYASLMLETDFSVSSHPACTCGTRPSPMCSHCGHRQARATAPIT